MKESVIKRIQLTVISVRLLAGGPLLRYCTCACKTTAWVCHILTNRLVSPLAADHVAS